MPGLEWKRCEEFGCYFAVDDGCLMSVAMMIDGSFDLYDGEINYGEVSEMPQSQKSVVQALFPKQEIFKAGCVAFY